MKKIVIVIINDVGAKCVDVYCLVLIIIVNIINGGKINKEFVPLNHTRFINSS